MVTCEVVEGRKGAEASRILAVDVPGYPDRRRRER